MSVCVYVCSVCIYICMNVCKYVCEYVYVCMAEGVMTSVRDDVHKALTKMIEMTLHGRGCQVGPSRPKLRPKMAPKWGQVEPKTAPT